ncbi:M23 family metallopeptidase [Gulosibacter bifidus]|uniref:M23 family metallopeptidase n=1 Tax=Gulosibacter bifidus TaxID=272239 RepID=A0ABW5RK69_9MICO|nr:M23 family metallopeptidase [Gulosibacter bifidus]
MITNADKPLPEQPLTRRELRELERAAEREAKLSELRKQADEAIASTESSAAELDAPAEPTFLSRRERREAERAAARAEQERLQTEAVAAAKAAVASNPECFAVQEAVAAPEMTVAGDVADSHDTVVAEPVAEQVVDTLDPTTAPIQLAQVVSLDEVRAARASDEQPVEDAVAAAPANEPQIPETFLRQAGSSTDSIAEVLRLRGRGGRTAGRFGGSMVAMSLLAGTVALGAGSAAAINALGNGEIDNEVLRTEAEAHAQKFSVDAAATVDVQAQAERGGDTTAVQSIGTAAAANLATGVKIPDASAYKNDMAANVQYPFPMGVAITDRYGYRDAPAGASSFHGGIDFTPGQGTPIGSLADGVVTKVDESQSSSFGIFVEVQHEINGERITTLYAHLDPGSVAVAKGDKVAVGDEIGKVGNTGISTGPHLHLEVHIGEKYVDPLYFLKKMNVAGVKVSIPETIAPDASNGTHEKLSHEASTALVDELAAKNGK